MRNYPDILAKKRAGDSLFELNTCKVPDAIRRFLQKAEKLFESSVFRNRISETRMFSGDLAGEYTIFGLNVIHLILKKKTAVA